MSAAANAAAFLSMRRRLPQDAGPRAHVPAPQLNPVRVAVLEPAAQADPVQAPVQVSYRKRRSILR